jgi:uncharacterized UBP type Zn finger protein
MRESRGSDAAAATDALKLNSGLQNVSNTCYLNATVQVRSFPALHPSLFVPKMRFRFLKQARLFCVFPVLDIFTFFIALVLTFGPNAKTLFVSMRAITRP